MTKKTRWVVALRLHSLSQARKMAFARLIRMAMQPNPLFASPPVSYAALQKQVTATHAAYIASRDSGKFERAVFRNELDKLMRMVKALGKYVQVIANKHADNGNKIIRSAAMDFRRHRKAQVHNFKAKNAGKKGRVKAHMKARVKEALYIWEYRESGSAAWIRASETLQATYYYENLQSGKRYEFRGAWQNRKGQRIFFHPVELVVM